MKTSTHHSLAARGRRKLRYRTLHPPASSTSTLLRGFFHIERHNQRAASSASPVGDMRCEGCVAPSLKRSPSLAFDREAHELALTFKRNFEQSGFETPDEVKAAGPAV
jgi:hypothetical protein